MYPPKTMECIKELTPVHNDYFDVLGGLQWEVLLVKH
jgi:hypothetical protein